MSASRWQEDLGIVLRSQPFRERDKLLTLLTEKRGRIGAVAKGAVHSKRYGGTLELFNCVEIRFQESQGSDLVRIEEANIRRDFQPLKEKLENLAAAGYFADLCLRLTEERQPAREIFLLLAHYYYLLEEKPATAEIVRSFEFKLLDRLGYCPSFETCASCAAELLERDSLSPRDYSVALDRGGFLCENCSPAGARLFYRATLAWLRAALTTPIQQTAGLDFPAEILAEGADLQRAFLQFHCPGLGRHSFQNHALLDSFLTK